MRGLEAKKLRVGDKVKWLPDETLGTVTEKSYAAIQIKWDDGKAGLFQFMAKDCPWNQIVKA